MMVVKFKSEHLNELLPRAGKVTVGMEHAAYIESQPHSFSAIDEGRVVLCGGFQSLWEGRVEAWILIDQTAKKKFLSIHKVVKRKLDELFFRRVEMVVHSKLKEGQRWATLLGFKKEATMHKYGPDGSDFVLFSRVN